MSKKLEAGDRVKVEFTGEVGCAGLQHDTHVVRPEGFTSGFPTVIPDRFLTKIEPPVEYFKPGDVVRAKHTSQIYALAKDGYLILRTGIFIRQEKIAGIGGTMLFNSNNYERLDLEKFNG